MLTASSAWVQRPPDLCDDDFALIARLIREHSGIVLAGNKQPMMVARLARRLSALGLSSFADYAALLRGPSAGEELGHAINALTTNVTRFFREPHHFDLLRTAVVAPRLAAGARRLRIWSAGCATGEEPYTIAMTLLDAIGDPSGLDIRILATDIDSEVLARAERGRFDIAARETIPPDCARRHTHVNPAGALEMSPAVRRLVTFRQFNLLQQFPMRGPFDAIFCRNVMIYFDRETQRGLLGRFAALLREGDYLFIGHSETLHGVDARFTLAGRTAYRKGA